MLTHERFAYLAEKYIDTVFRVAFSYLKSREDADDVTQDVFMKLYSVDTEFESEEHIRNWLIRVTINQCRKQFRSPWRRLENIDDYAAALSFEDDNDRNICTAHRQRIRCQPLRKQPGAGMEDSTAGNTENEGHGHTLTGGADRRKG